MKPFDGPNFYKNAQKAGELTPCVICGKGVKITDKTPFVFVISGGAEFGDMNSDRNDSGYMGCYPVGPDCWKRHHQELTPHKLVMEKRFEDNRFYDLDGKTLNELYAAKAENEQLKKLVAELEERIDQLALERRKVRIEELNPFKDRLRVAGCKEASFGVMLEEIIERAKKGEGLR